MIGQGGGRGQSVLDCNYMPGHDDGVAHAEDEAAEDLTESETFEDDDGAGCSVTDSCSASCATSGWLQVEMAEVESCSSDGSMGVISDDECMSRGDSSHVSSLDDDSSSCGSYDACMSEGDLVWSNSG